MLSYNSDKIIFKFSLEDQFTGIASINNARPIILYKHNFHNPRMYSTSSPLLLVF